MDMKKRIDFNCDLGELEDGGFIDNLILPYVTSANIACGYHAGSKEAMARTVKAAMNFGCNIGAHPGFLDRENFGRTEMNLSLGEIEDIVYKQIMLLKEICDEEGAHISHVKPHGALYNMAAKDYDISLAICRGILDAYPDNPPLLMGLSGSLMEKAAKVSDIAFASEVFSDRGYMPDGTLVPRTNEGALISDEDEIEKRVIDMVTLGEVTAIDGSRIKILADTLCLHGDGENAVPFAKRIRASLENVGINVVPL